jgi:hypothetical protein
LNDLHCLRLNWFAQKPTQDLSQHRFGVRA